MDKNNLSLNVILVHKNSPTSIFLLKKWSNSKSQVGYLSIQIMSESVKTKDNVAKPKYFQHENCSLVWPIVLFSVLVSCRVYSGFEAFSLDCLVFDFIGMEPVKVKEFHDS